MPRSEVTEAESEDPASAPPQTPSAAGQYLVSGLKVVIECPVTHLLAHRTPNNVCGTEVDGPDQTRASIASRHG
jgi:hypothetical protein